MPVVGTSNWIPRPIGAFLVDEDDVRAGIFLIVIRPHIEIAQRRSGFSVAGTLKPRMLVRRMIGHKLSNDADAAGMGRTQELTEVGKRAVIRVDVAIGADVVAVVQPRRRIKRQTLESSD